MKSQSPILDKAMAEMKRDHCLPTQRGTLPQTQIEEDYGYKFSEAEWEAVEALEGISDALAKHCCEIINRDARKVASEPIKYNAQWTLEKLISKLQAMV